MNSIVRLITISSSLLFLSFNSYANNSYPNQGDRQAQTVTEKSQRTRSATGQEEVAYMDERGKDIHHRANRQGDWGYRQNWRYDRDAFYKGETQGEAYDIEHPEGVGGPGMNVDKDYLQMRKYYLEHTDRNPRENPYPANHSNSQQNYR